MRRRSPTLLHLLLLLILPLIFSPNAEGGKGRVHITDDLDDVIDDEEDEDWKEWGKKKTPSDDEFDPPKIDYETMDLAQIQEEMLRKQFGPSFGFVKLRLESHRTPDMVADIAMKWTKVMKTGGLDVKFMGVDVNTVMFTMQRGGQDTLELKDFILNQPEAYEIKIGDQGFRRPGDIPLEELVEKLRREENKDGGDDDRREYSLCHYNPDSTHRKWFYKTIQLKLVGVVCCFGPFGLKGMLSCMAVHLDLLLKWLPGSNFFCLNSKILVLLLVLLLLCSVGHLLPLIV